MIFISPEWAHWREPSFVMVPGYFRENLCNMYSCLSGIFAMICFMVGFETTMLRWSYCLQQELEGSLHITPATSVSIDFNTLELEGYSSFKQVSPSPVWQTEIRRGMSNRWTIHLDYFAKLYVRFRPVHATTGVEKSFTFTNDFSFRCG